ncbi:alanine--tRNA ligase [Calidifontibacter sp. DB0510]|uniref:Alanine--tRNA ligase n=1 Tax=Metallococcus carri TaxID=1656884 RepID=A0A967B5J2_9MICO|nr:alanine--tRNA ligase [Metallococcus carri]NHN55031.1 alanine--tRNA ligase [Metallococcus carri]NOP37377.1 alanine--tRNA ligase [Calidifontibacter sp. DB2511S]
METAEIRRRWLAYFESRDHHVVPSAPLIYDDPNLLFVNAGMVPMKPYMLGQQTPPWPRATSVQKCVRTGDIEEVGKTSRHGTFFQMNGNFSFGDYFKQRAIELAWGLVTTPQSEGGYGLDPERIWPTVFQDDDEAFAIWRDQIGIPEQRITRRDRNDNYWHMGVPGPGGPCSELFYDRGPEYGAEGGPAVDEDRYMEFWNLVFMQDDLSAVRSKADFDIAGPLPTRNIDTGMGLERMATLLQGVDNLYEIDEVFPVLDRAAELTGKQYGAHSQHDAAHSHPDDVHLRVVADHVRSSLMLIGDGVTPGNEGRGYVLRRMLRRAVRAMRLLGYTEPALPQLLPVSMERMKASYPELETDFARISQIAYGEEEAFRRTLVQGTQILDTAVTKAKQTAASTGSTTARLPGERAFALHDTYGFPIDLTLEMAAEQGVEVDEQGFRRLMTEQRERAKADAKAKKSGHAGTEVWRELRELGATDWLAYQGLSTEATVRGLVVDGQRVEELAPGQTGQLVLDRTTFYAESGGQIADSGVITGPRGDLTVQDVQRPVKGLVVHTVIAGEQGVQVGDAVEAKVDPEWRVSACQAHSGTHVVHAALRQVLGPSALQSGSYNKPGYLRLDFAWNSALSAATRSEIEEVANLAVRQDLPVSAQFMTLPEAREWGALALFGETYDEQVRVVEIGGPWSRELCGGTHVQHSSQIGALTLTGESSVGSGVRRVEAFVGMDALRYLAKERALVAELSSMVKVAPGELPERVSDLLQRVKDAEREITKLRQQQVLAQTADLAQNAKDVHGVRLVAHDAGEIGGDDVRSLVLKLREDLGDGAPAVVAVTGTGGGRPVVVVATNSGARDQGVRAGDLVKVAASALGGGGGGKPDLAQGGGQDPTKVGAALREIEQALAAR